MAAAKDSNMAVSSEPGSIFTSKEEQNSAEAFFFSVDNIVSIYSRLGSVKQCIAAQHGVVKCS